MAIVKNPTASLFELGILSETLDVYQWKGLTVVRKHSHAFDPRNPAQIVQRSRMTAAVRWWKLNGHPVDVKASWNRYAQYKTITLPGYHVALSNIMRASGVTPNAHIVTHATHWTPTLVLIYTRPIDLGPSWPEPGLYHVAYSSQPTGPFTIKLVSPGSGGTLQLFLPPGLTLPLYVHVYKKHSRSGIVKTAPPI